MLMLNAEKYYYCGIEEVSYYSSEDVVPMHKFICIEKGKEDQILYVRKARYVVPDGNIIKLSDPVPNNYTRPRLALLSGQNCYCTGIIDGINGNDFVLKDVVVCSSASNLEIPVDHVHMDISNRNIKKYKLKCGLKVRVPCTVEKYTRKKGSVDYGVKYRNGKKIKIE